MTMTFRTIEVPGIEAVERLNEYRSRYQESGEYPFLIGDDEQHARIKGPVGYDDRTPAEIMEAFQSLKLDQWLVDRKTEAQEFGFEETDVVGDWPGEIMEKGEVGLHRDILTGTIKDNVFLGLASVEEPWQLPSVLKYGGWNACPVAEVHCAFHKKWQEEFGAEITGMSSDVVECTVANPPSDQEQAIKLAWEQYWYCGDIVEQGCETIDYLALNQASLSLG